MKWISFLLILLFLTGCAAPPPAEPLPEASISTVPTQPEPTSAPTETEPPDPILVLVNTMTVEERVGQLFLARCSAETALADIETYHLGGFVLFAKNFENETVDSIRQTLSGYQSAAKIPMLLAVDEEGGTVTRISCFPAFRSEKFYSPRSLYDWGGQDAVLTVEEEKCQLLQSLGLNVNLGPVCDITTDSGAFMYRRSLGQDAKTTANVVSAQVMLMNAYSIGSVLKHFPGYGNNSDTHTGLARDSRSLEELESRDLIPFSAGMDAGCGAVLVSHTIVEALDDTLPASLSPAVHRYLRQTMGFDGVILTDDLVMQAISDQYGAGEAAVMAVQAGNDLLCSTNYPEQYTAVLNAVLDGRIDFDQLNESVTRVLKWKQSLGLI